MVASGGDGDSIANELDALTARVGQARAGLDARMQTTAIPGSSVEGSAGILGIQPSQRRVALMLAVALVLLGAGIGAAVTVVTQRGRGVPAQSATAATVPATTPTSTTGITATPPTTGRTATPPTTGRTVTPSTTGTSVPVVSTPGPVTTNPAAQTAQPPPAQATALSSTIAATQQASGTVTALFGDSLWSIAARHVASTLGRQPSASETARYWVRLVGANQGRLPRRGNSDLIYPGQQISLP